MRKLRPYPWKGYLLVSKSTVGSYRGVDRQPFTPSFDDIEVQEMQFEGHRRLRVSDFHSSGWRKEAYKIYEDNLVEGTGDFIDLLSSLEAARRIAAIIEDNIGPHEILECQLWGESNAYSLQEPDDINFLGIDVAYPGGDFYSAILNGLFISPDPILLREFKVMLNQFGLFDEVQIAVMFPDRFRERVLSESDSEFCFYNLILIE